MQKNQFEIWQYVTGLVRLPHILLSCCLFISLVFSDEDLASVLRSIIEQMSINPEVDVKVVVAMDTRLVMVHRVQTVLILTPLIRVHKPISGNQNLYFIP